MAIAVVANTIQRSGDGNNVTTGSIDTTGASLLVAVVSTFAGSGTVSDSKGNTWTPRTQYGSGSDTTVRIYYAENPSVGSGHTFSVAASGKAPTISVVALSGAATASAYDQENGSGLSLADTVQPGSVTPSEDNEIVITGTSGYSTGPASINGGFTIADSATYNTTGMSGGLAYLIQTTATAANPTWTYTGAGVLAACSATFKEAAAGGSTFTATVAVAASLPTFAATATHTPPVFTANAAVSATLPTLAASGTATGPSFDATAAVSASLPTLAASAAHTAPVFTANAAVTATLPTFAATATHDAPTFTATAALAATLPTFAADATHEAPVFTGSAALTLTLPTFAATALFADDLFQATGTFTLPTPTFAATATFLADVSGIPVSATWVAGGPVRTWIAAAPIRRWLARRNSRMTKNTVYKHPEDALIRYEMDFSDLPELDGATISSVTDVSASPVGLTIGSSQVEDGDKSVSAVFSGGTDGTDYEVTFTVALNTSATLARTGLMQVRER